MTRAATPNIYLLIVALVVPLACSQQKVTFRTEPVVQYINDNFHIDCPGENDYNRFTYTIDLYLNRQLDDLINPVDPPPAMNVNSLDEVPNSSWFTNRMGILRMTRREVASGPGGEENSPQLKLPWKVYELETSERKCHLKITDIDGQSFTLKFNSADSYEAGTASEVIASRLMYAAGYNVAESYIVNFGRNDLRSDSLSTPADQNVTEEEIDRFLSTLVRSEDGRYRAVAVREIDGVDCGIFPMTGTRCDDPNDLIPHEHRRELRALRVFSAWLGHVDVTPDNGRDMYVDGEGDSYIRHYLTDFDDCFGTYFLDNLRAHPGYEYQMLDMKEIVAGMFTFGSVLRDWEKVPRQSYTFAGPYYETESFDIAKWKPIYPVPYFSQMTPQDAFWAAKIIAVFGDDHFNGALREAQMSSSSEQYLVDVLKKRRTKILEWAFSNVNPLDDFKLVFKIQGLVLGFINLAEKYALSPGKDFEYDFKIMDRNYNTLYEMHEKSIPQHILPDRLLGLSGEENYLIIEIRTTNTATATVSPAARAHFYGGRETGLTLIGIERDS